MCLLVALVLDAGATTAPADAHGLDLATAAFVADFDYASYVLCGEGDCDYEAALCVRFDAHQVDCAVGWQSVDGPRRCGVVIRAVLRGSRLFHGDYECRGRLQPLLAERFIRFDKRVRLRRFRADIDWPASDETNLYGVPHYDTRREVYTGGALPLTGANPWVEVLLGLAAIAAGVTLRAGTRGRIRRARALPTAERAPRRTT